MKKFWKHLVLLLVLVANTATAWANEAVPQDVYADIKAVSKDTGGGLVYASATNDANGSYETTSTAHQDNEGQLKSKTGETFTFYLFATGGSGVPVWYTDAACTNEVNGTGNGHDYTGKGIKVDVYTDEQSRGNSSNNPTIYYMKYVEVDRYSRLTVTGSSDVLVYASATELEEDPDESDFATSKTVSKTSPKDPHTYYLYATCTGGGVPMWYKGSTLLGVGNTFEYNVTASSYTESSPSTDDITVRRGTAAHGYIEATIGGANYLISVDNGIRYTYSGTTATIADQNKNQYLVGNITIPSTVTDESGKSYTVTALAGGAFLGCSNITGLTFPSTLTTINKATINPQIYYPSSPVSSFTGSGAFAGCVKLTSVDFSACTFTKTEGAMFVGCAKLTDVKFPNTLTELTQYDFLACNSLVTLDLRNCTALKKIGDYTAHTTQGSGALQYVYIPESVEEIGESAFCYQRSLKKITDLGEATRPTAEEIAEHPYLTAESNLSSVSHLGHVKKIGSYAFTECFFLHTFVASSPELTSIEAKTFRQSNAMYDLILGENVSSIGNEAFKTCGGLQRINYPGSGVTIDKDGRLTYNAIVFPPSLKTLADKAFGEDLSSNGAFKKIYFPASFTTAGQYALYGYPPTATNDVHIYSYATTAPRIYKNSSSGTFCTGLNATLHIIDGASDYTSTGSSGSSRCWGYYFPTQLSDIVTSKTVSAPADQWTAVCLPERAVQPAGATFYTLARKVVEGGAVKSLVLAPVAEGAALEAGTPYIYKGGDATFKYVYGAKPADEALTVNGLHGTFAETAGVYTFIDGTLTEDATCTANGAYIVLDEVTAGDEAGAGEESIELVTERYTFSDGRTEEEVTAAGLAIMPDEAFDFCAPSEVVNGKGYCTLKSMLKVDIDNTPSSAPRRVMSRAALTQEEIEALGLLQGDYIVPATIIRDNIEYTVNAIAPYAFAGQYLLRSVTIPSTVATIETRVEHMDVNGFDRTVQDASGLFYMCFSLEEVTFDEASPITDLGSGCFFGCYNLKEIKNLPKNLTRIADGMFVGCYSLGYTDDADDVQYQMDVDDYITRKCQTLDLRHHTKLENIGYLAFYRNGIPANSSFAAFPTEFKNFFNFTRAEMEEKLNIDASEADAYWEQYEGRGITRVILPANTEIGIKYGAFSEAMFLMHISTPDATDVSDLSTVNNLGQYAFAHTDLKNLKLTNTAIKTVPNSAFTHCEKLETLEVGAGLLEFGQRSFYDCKSLKSVTSTGTTAQEGVYNLHEGLKHIAAEAFYGNVQAKRINLPTTLERISTRAFMGASGLDLVVASSETAPLLGKTGSGNDNDIVNKNANNEGYMSAEEDCETLTEGETQVANPDVFFANADDMTAPVVFVPAGKKAAYAKGWDSSFYIVEKHKRNISANFGTICLAYDAEKPEGLTLYEVVDMEKANGELQRVDLDVTDECDYVVAGRPYFFKAETAIGEHEFEPKTDLNFARVGGSNNGLHGALVATEVNAGAYMLKSNLLYKVKEGSKCSAYRAWLDGDADVAPAVYLSPRAVSFHLGDTATGVLTLDGDAQAVDGRAYDLQGRRINGNAHKGVVIVGGKKSVIK